MTSFQTRAFVVTLLCLFFAGNLVANNGTINYAYPMNPITVDGDLSDWPSSAPFKPLETFLFGSELGGEHDIQARYRVGYNLQTKMLYVAVETTDDAPMGDTSQDAEWNTHDMHNLYVDISHSLSSGPISHLVSPDYRRIAEKRPHESWDPQVRNSSWDNLKVEIRKNGNTTVYEWSFFIGDQIAVGRSIGFDYEVLDKDPGESGFPSVLAIGPGPGKAFNTVSMSDLILLGADTKLGTLTGKVNWKEESALKVPGRITITSVENPKLWVVANVDEQGNYSVELPLGSYQLGLTYKVRFADNGPDFAVMDIGQGVKASVKNEGKSTAPDLVIGTKTIPDIIPAKGILHQYASAQGKEVDNFMKVMMDYYNVPGVSLALVRKGKVVHAQTYGYKNAFAKEKVDTSTLFEAASVTKPVFAFAVNRLVERGEFDLDKPLHEYLPFEAISGDERYKLMTGRHVLIHTSGLPNWGQEMQETPGTKFGYSGEGFEYLKRVVAHVSKRDIEKLVKEEVLEPLGISHTYFSKNDELMKVISYGHYGNQPTIYDVPTEPGMAHSMYTEAHTFANFMIGLLERKGLKPATYEEMFRRQTQLPSIPYLDKIGWDQSFGLGIISADTPYGKMYGHGGNNGDFRCQFEIFDTGKIGFAIFTNGSNGHLLADALREFLITGKVEETER